MYRFTLGHAAITLINAGDIRADLRAWFGLPLAESQPSQDSVQPVAVPMQNVHIALGQASVLVDASRWAFAPDSEFYLPGYSPPPTLATQLAAAGVVSGEITHVVITHAHFDHFNGLADPTDGDGKPCFPNARHYLSQADWESADIQSALRHPHSLTDRTLGMLHRRGSLALVNGDLGIADGIAILAAPGETPGHQIVRVQSEGKVLYCIGDLYHHPLEVERPDRQVWWADAKANRASRERMVSAALREDALVIAAHIRGLGKLRQTADGVRWVTVDVATRQGT